MRAILSVALILAASTVARADTNTTEARAAYDAGVTGYNLGEYARALDDFKRAYRLLRDPTLLFNIGQCERQLGNPEGAQRSYRAFLREASGISDGRRDEVQRLIASMDAAIRDRRAVQPPTGMIRAQDAPAAPATVAIAPPLVVDTPAPLPVQRERRPIHKRVWFWCAVGGAAVAVALGVGIGVGLQSSTTYPTATTTLGTVRW